MSHTKRYTVFIFIMSVMAADKLVIEPAWLLPHGNDEEAYVYTLVVWTQPVPCPSVKGARYGELQAFEVLVRFVGQERQMQQELPYLPPGAGWPYGIALYDTEQRLIEGSCERFELPIGGGGYTYRPKIGEIPFLPLPEEKGRAPSPFTKEWLQR